MKVIVNLFLVLAVFALGTVGHESTAKAGLLTWSFEDECWDEGCSGGEKYEYYRKGSYHEECNNEGCDSHERLELVEAWDHSTQHMRDTHDYMLYSMEYMTQGGGSVWCYHFYGAYFQQYSLCRNGRP